MNSKQFNIRPSEVDSNLREKENQLVHVGVVISTMVIIATVASILFSTFDYKPFSINKINSVGKTEPA